MWWIFGDLLAMDAAVDATLEADGASGKRVELAAVGVSGSATEV